MAARDRRFGTEVRNCRTGRAKVKSGCYTCKTRKVKCDEDRPACRRCVSTGRICDGYGIWGGGNRPAAQPPSSMALQAAVLATPPPLPLSLVTVSTDEKACLEWFRYRTCIKLPGSFTSGFWSTLVFQSSPFEPAILHAILALSSVHKRGTLISERRGTLGRGIDETETFMLNHYIKAIGHLRPAFSTRDTTCHRVALITCVIFVSLDLLRGHFETAQRHLQSGLRILEESQISCTRSHDRESVDNWIIEGLSRFRFQMGLFKQSYQYPCPRLQLDRVSPHSSNFYNFKEAWLPLEQLVNAILKTSEQCHRRRQSGFTYLHQYPALIQDQKRIRTEISCWHETFQASKNALQNISLEAEKAYKLLSLFGIMANIMVDTCLWPGDESAFDSQAHRFMAIIKISIELESNSSRPSLPSFSRSLVNMSRSLVDIGWIPPLYYTAIKCRIHRLRVQALRLVESCHHREGIWDGKIAACAARKVIELEERDFYQNLDLDDGFPLHSPPCLEDLLLPTLPVSYRIREVHVVLAGSPTDKIRLFDNQNQNDGDHKAPLGEYSMDLDRWV